MDKLRALFQRNQMVMRKYSQQEQEYSKDQFKQLDKDSLEKMVLNDYNMIKINWIDIAKCYIW